MWLRGACVATGLSLLLACGDDGADGRGQPCQSDATCDGLLCVGDLSAMTPDLTDLPLVCDAASDARGPAEACDTAEQCALHVCLLAGACARPCGGDGDCEAAERCQPVFARTGSESLARLPACVALVDVPRGVRVRRELREGALHGRQEALSLPGSDTPELVVLEHLGDDRWPLPGDDGECRPPLCASKLVQAGASAEVLFDLETLPGQADGPLSPVSVGDHVDPLSLLLPAGPRIAPSPDGYEITVRSKTPGDLRITRMQRDEAAGLLDLNLYYVGADELSAMGDRGETFIEDALAEIDRIFAQAGVQIGDVRQIAVGGALPDEGVMLQTVEGTGGFAHLTVRLGVHAMLPELFKLGAGAGNSALDVFFVGDIEPPRPDAGDIAGLSGGTPGPLGMHGTAGSGIAIAANMMVRRGDAAALGRTLAHEIGHMLGLFHTTEATGLVLDPLPDTPVCPLANDTNGDGLVAGECAGEGADNLMFPTTGTTDTKLTPDQQRVLRRAVILR